MSQAFDGAHEAAARAVVSSTNLRERFYGGIIDQCEKFFLFVPDPERGLVMGAVRRKLEEEHPWDVIEGIAARAYATHLSEDELYALGQLFQQPIGRRWLQVQDKVAHDLQRGLFERQRNIILESMGFHPDENCD